MGSLFVCPQTPHSNGHLCCMLYFCFFCYFCIFFLFLLLILFVFYFERESFFPHDSRMTLVQKHCSTMFWNTLANHKTMAPICNACRSSWCNLVLFIKKLTLCYVHYEGICKNLKCLKFLIGPLLKSKTNL